MPDPLLILKACLAAALLAAAVLLFGARIGGKSHSAWRAASGALGTGLGFFVGCLLLGLRPHWPPQEDQDRLLLVVIPAVIGVELVAAFTERLWWLGWFLRLVVAGSVARVLLHDSIYLADLAGPGTREWTPAQSRMILAGLAAALAGTWLAMAALAGKTTSGAPSASEARARGTAVVVSFILATAGAAITIMFSGYASGGQLGLPLAAALSGTAVACLFVNGPVPIQSVISTGVVGLFSLLIMGRFFGELATSHAALLFFAPLLGWLTELPYIHRIRYAARGIAAVLLTAAPIAVSLLLAQQRFAEDSNRTGPGPREPSIEDYMNFGR
jgi:hypothetical protein